MHLVVEPERKVHCVRCYRRHDHGVRRAYGQETARDRRPFDGGARPCFLDRFIVADHGFRRQTHQHLRHVRVRSHHALTHSLTHSRPNRTKCSGSASSVASLSGHASWVLSVAASPNGRTFASGYVVPRSLSHSLVPLTLLADTARVTGRSRCGTWRREVASTRSTTIRIKCGAWRTAPPAASSRRSRTTSSSWSTTASSVVVVVTNKSTQSTNQGSRQLRRLFTLRRTHAHARTNARIPSRSIDR